jgi:arylsulfatase A-like enzyme
VRPNVLLVVLDTARRDAVEPYCGVAGATPAVAELAERGWALPRAYAPSSWTLPSHASMFTGLLPRRLGLTQAPAGSPQSARPALERVADRLLPAVLRSAGYATHGWSNNLWASPWAGFDIGFDSFEYVASDRTERAGVLAGDGLRSRLAWAREGLQARSDDGAAAVAHALERSIERWNGQPTLWFANLVECHSPYLPPQPWNDLGRAARVRAALEASRYLSFEAICLYAAGAREIPAEALERMRHLYARAAAYMDGLLAGVFATLDARGILDETLVIVTSDHGENFGENGLISHGFSLDERLIHVPFVTAGPGAHAIDHAFSLAAVPRFVAEAVGLTEHPWGADELPDGIAVAQYDPLGDAEHPRVQDAVERWSLSAAGVERLTARLTCATDGVLKLVVRDRHELVFDLRSDPLELAPLGNGSAPSGVASLRAALDHPAAGERVGPPAAASIVPSPDEVAEIEQQMKLLGYL